MLSKQKLLRQLPQIHQYTNPNSSVKNSLTKFTLTETVLLKVL